MNNKERFRLIPEVYLVLMQHGKILLLRRRNTGYEDGNYSMIAGHADGNETMREAIAREALEEGGIIVKPQELNLILTMHRWCGDHERIALFFKVDDWTGKIINMEPNKCDDLRWFPLNQLPSNTIPYIHTAIDCCVRGVRYIEFAWER